MQTLTRLKQQAVTPVLNVGDDPCSARRHGLVLPTSALLVFLPGAPFNIEQKAVRGLILAPHPAEIDTPEGRGMAIGELRQALLRLALFAGPSHTHRRTAFVFLKAHRRANIVAQSHT